MSLKVSLRQGQTLWQAAWLGWRVIRFLWQWKTDRYECRREKDTSLWYLFPHQLFCFSTCLHRSPSFEAWPKVREEKNDADLKTWCGFISYSHCSLLLQGPQLPNLKPQHRSLSKTPAKGEAKAKSQLATYTPAIPPLLKGSISSHRGAKLDARTARVVLHRMEILVPVRLITR